MKILGNATRTGKPYPTSKRIYTESGVIVEHEGTKFFIEEATADDLKDLDWQDVEIRYVYDEIDDTSDWTYSD